MKLGMILDQMVETFFGKDDIDVRKLTMLIEQANNELGFPLTLDDLVNWVVIRDKRREIAVIRSARHQQLTQNGEPYETLHVGNS